MYLFVSTFIFMIRSVMQWLRMIVAVHSICISEYWPAQYSPAQQLYLHTAIVAAISGAAVHSRPQIKQNESHLHITFIFIYSPARSSSTRHFILSVPYYIGNKTRRKSKVPKQAQQNQTRRSRVWFCWACFRTLD